MDAGLALRGARGRRVPGEGTDGLTRAVALYPRTAPVRDVVNGQVAVQAGVSHFAARDALDALVSVGVVASSITGRSRVHWLERRSLVVRDLVLPALTAEADSFERVLEEIRRVLSPQVLSAILFGSYARGEQTAESDIDVLIVAGSAEDIQAVVTALDTRLADLRATLGASVSVSGYTMDQARALLASGDNLGTGVVRDGVLVAGSQPAEWGAADEGATVSREDVVLSSFTTSSGAPTLDADRRGGETMTDEVLGLVIDRLVERFDPIRIVLFGSHARGDAREDSDIDVLVVLERMEHKRRTLAAMLDALADLPVSVDPIPTDEAEIQRRGAIAGDILRPALREGEVIHERAACAARGGGAVARVRA